MPARTDGLRCANNSLGPDGADRPRTFETLPSHDRFELFQSGEKANRDDLRASRRYYERESDGLQSEVVVKQDFADTEVAW